MAFDSAGEAIGNIARVACFTLLILGVLILIIALPMSIRRRALLARAERLGIWLEGGPGDTIGRAIIRCTASSVEGVQAERQYLARQRGPEGQAWRVVHQATLARDGRHYDALTIG